VLSVAWEFARALGAVLLFPWRLMRYLQQRQALRQELLDDLAGSPTEHRVEVPAGIEGPLHVFVSCAEASGELHALNTIRALRRRCAELGMQAPTFSGLGGERLAAEGVRTIEDPVRRAVMGFSAVLGSLPFYLRLLTRAARHLRRERPDVCLFVDSPALHIPLGRIARRAGVPVVHFVAPQHWGWAPWRARGYRSAVDCALTILPFEQAWFARRNVPTAHVGHPLLDALAQVPHGAPDENSRTIVLLPGSRRKVIDANLPWMLARLMELRAQLPDLQVVLPHARSELADLLRAHIAAAGVTQWVRIETTDLHQSLRGARAAFAVSGTVLLDLLHHRLPTVVVYRLTGKFGTWMYNNLLSAPWFSITNLLAAREVLPEFCFVGEGPLPQVREALRRAFDDPQWRARCAEGLALAAVRLGPPGACDRAAEHLLATVDRTIVSNGVS
jgi:lipid-A-disaccharide synthase